MPTEIIGCLMTSVLIHGEDTDLVVTATSKVEPKRTQ